MSYQSCGNCGVKDCQFFCLGDDWVPLPCPKCGGILSEIRVHDGKAYRHCYACHFEFPENDSPDMIEELVRGLEGSEEFAELIRPVCADYMHSPSAEECAEYEISMRGAEGH